MPQLLGPRFILAGRYQLEQQLGVGGMGTVFKALDTFTGEHIAVKLIRPELTISDASLTRFKHELRITHAINHPNVVRTYDLNSDGALKFISMALVEGQSLAQIRSGPEIPISRVVAIIQQICDGLEAAHSHHIVHRDLKPQNIMVEQDGKALVMDFGLAQCEALPDVTQQGTFLGTPDYCSPEQVLGVEVDPRSDIFSLGVIFYELLTSALPFARASSPAAMFQRYNRRPTPPSVINPRVPKKIDRIVLKCLESDRERRYSTVLELKRDLDLVGDPSPSRTVLQWPRRLTLIATAIGVISFAAVAIGITQYLRATRDAATAAASPSRVLLADLDNQTGDSMFDGALEPLITIALEESRNVSCLDRASAHKLAQEIHRSSGRLDAATARLAAMRNGFDVVVDGVISQADGRYRLKLEAINARTGRVLASPVAEAADRPGLLAEINGVVRTLRRALGDRLLTKTKFGEETFTANSLESAHLYATAQESLLSGRYEDSLQQYLAAAKVDPNLGRAWAGAAASYLNLGNRDEAGRLFRIALSHMARMTDREKFRTRGGYYIASGDYSHAIEEYSQLVREYPFDNAGHANLGLAYFYKFDFKDAIEEGRKAVDIYPENAAQQNNVSWYALYAGDFARAERDAQQALRLNGKLEKGWVALALAHFGKERRDNAAADWSELAKTSARGKSLAALGSADLAVMEGRPEDALAILGSAADEDIASNRRTDAAIKHAIAAEALLSEGKTREAQIELGRALGISRDRLVEFPAARVYIALRKWDDAHRIVQELKGAHALDAQLQARLIEGEIQLNEGNAANAIEHFKDASTLGDSWLGRLDLAQAYIAQGEFAQADTELDTCNRRRGEALAVFQDDRPTLRYLAPMYYYAARTQEGLSSPSAAEAYRLFLNIRKGHSEPLARDAEKRLLALTRPI